MALIMCDVGRAIETMSEEKPFLLYFAESEKKFMRDGQFGLAFDINAYMSNKIPPYEVTCFYDLEDAGKLDRRSNHIFFGRLLSFEQDKLELDCRVATDEDLAELFGDM